MQSHYHSIYISPHLDDAVLSCGGQIFEETQRGKPVLVVTVMAGDPPKRLSAYAQSLHQRWNLPTQAVSARRREDQAACALLGADTHQWPYLDCIYRHNPTEGNAFYQSDADLFGPVHPQEAPLIDQLITQFNSLPPCHRIVAPLTVGNHVDHQLVRQAAERYFGHRLEFYEDFPYVQTPEALDFLRAAGQNVWTSTVISLSQAALQAKIEAILAYKSQLSTFFINRRDLEQQVLGYAQRVGGERFWKPIRPDQ